MDVTVIRNRGRRDVCLFVNFIGVTILKHRRPLCVPLWQKKEGKAAGRKELEKYMNGKRRRSSELSTYGTYYLYTITTYKLHKNTTTTEPLQMM